MKNNDYWQKRIEAKAYYSSLGKIWCPAVSDWVVFNIKGFNHLVRKGRFLRSEQEQLRRFFLFKKNYVGREVIVVVRQFAGGSNHFFSIMDRLY